jgi:hypothetical protein|tara:strand:+ start:312 stop:449 length:138 start_codon:yes stop_codon:yes gene_type:complete
MPVDSEGRGVRNLDFKTTLAKPAKGKVEFDLLAKAALGRDRVTEP